MNKVVQDVRRKQREWAATQGIATFGGTLPDKGEKNYVDDLDRNLLCGRQGNIVADYSRGDGGEMRDTVTRRAKMKALHSSSALVVNLFQHWRGRDLTPLLYACGLIASDDGTERKYDMRYEERFAISDAFRRVPNLDVTIHAERTLAVEAKFLEPYAGAGKGICGKYVERGDLWCGLSNLRELAAAIAPENRRFKCLDAAQLIKHILGLNAQCGEGRFCLLYLWYDLPQDDAKRHRKEIEAFSEVAGKDGVDFRHITYQKVIACLSEKYSEGNEEYVEYLRNRYL